MDLLVMYIDLSWPSNAAEDAVMKYEIRGHMEKFGRHKYSLCAVPTGDGRLNELDRDDQT